MTAPAMVAQDRKHVVVVRVYFDVIGLCVSPRSTLNPTPPSERGDEQDGMPPALGLIACL